MYVRCFNVDIACPGQTDITERKGRVGERVGPYMLEALYEIVAGIWVVHSKSSPIDMLLNVRQQEVGNILLLDIIAFYPDRQANSVNFCILLLD